MTDKKNYLIRFTPLFLIILNVFLKLLFISSNSIGGDEPFSIYHSQMDISSIIHKLSSGNNPPLYEIILHFWIKTFGISELSVRFPSFIFSVLTVYFIYRIGKDFFNYQIALIAGLLFSFSNYHILFSHEARVYALFAMLTAISMFCFLTICNKKKGLTYYFLLLIINVILLYSHYFGLYVVFVQTIVVFSLKNIREQVWRNYLVYCSILTALYIPILHILIMRFMDSSMHGTWVKSPNGPESIYNMIWQFSNKPLTAVISICIVFAAFIKLIFKRDIKNSSVNSKIIIIWFLVPFLFMFIASYWVPMFLDRYLIFVSLAYYLILAICANYIIDKRPYAVIIQGILVMLFIFTFNPNMDNKRHVKEMVEKIKKLKEEETKVLICPQQFILNFAYYYDLKAFQDADTMSYCRKMTKKFNKQNIYPINNINEVDFIGFEKIIYIDAAAQFSFPDNNILYTLDKAYQLKEKYEFYEIFKVYEFQKR